MQRLLAWTAIALLAMASPTVTAQNGTDDQLGDVVDDTTNSTKNLIDGLKGVAEGIGDAAEATGDGIADGASAVGKGIGALVRAIGTAALASLTGLAQGGAAVSTAFAAGVTSTFQGIAWLGAAFTTVAFVATEGVGWALAAAWGGFATLGSLYGGLVGSMRPEAMPVAAFASVTAVGAAGSASAGGWAGFQALRKWGLAGSGVLGAAGFSRINDADLLQHPLRGQIFDVIKTNPGIHASQLAREMDVGWGTITHHLDKLQKGKLVATRKVNNQKCFFEQGGEISRADMAIASALKGDTAAGIAGFVGSNPMTSQKTLAEALDISPALASFHVKKLVNLGVLEKFRHGKETLLTTSEGLRRVMASADPAVSAALQSEESGFEYSS